MHTPPQCFSNPKKYPVIILAPTTLAPSFDLIILIMEQKMHCWHDTFNDKAKKETLWIKHITGLGCKNLAKLKTVASPMHFKLCF